MRTWLLTVVLVAYLGALGWGTLSPTQGVEIRRASREVKAVERSVKGIPEPAQRVRTPPRFAGLTGEEIANVAAFAPFGVLVPLRFRRRRWWTVPAGVAVSGAIELAQWALLEHRTASWRDWWLNSVGVLAGFALYLAAVAVWRRARPVAAA